jgi:MFS transporter, DHA1 family, multidrug resistance protein
MRGSGRLSIEFILLVALLNAMVAMSIDTMLPAIGSIAEELGARTRTAASSSSPSSSPG